MAQPITLALSGITKVYPGAVALNGVSLEVTGGEIVGLIGENGAGKSTLMKVLGGTVRPDGGRITVDGEAHDGLTPRAAQASGIALVHQELNTFSNLDVAGNILLGREPRRGLFRLMDRAAMAREVQPYLDMLGARFRPGDSAADLSLADQQLLEIARALSMRARLVVLDEPTSSLTLSETERLIAVMRDLRAQGVAVLFITHRLDEIRQVCDRVVVLRDGNNAGALNKAEITRDRMVEMMVGRRIGRHAGHRTHAAGRPVLEIEALRTRAYPHAPVSLSVKSGEILGLAGLVGAGRSELARTVFGIDAKLGGTIRLDGMPLRDGVAAAIASGVCLVPENRKEEGLILDFPVVENVSLPNLAGLSRRGLVDRRAEAAMGDTARARLGIKTASLQTAVGALSGGNQQKVVLAKWLAMNPRVIILDEPTRGIDVGAKGEVYALMRALAGQGVAILMISSDMEEVIGVSDRVAVMREGGVTGILPQDALSEQAILGLAVS
ncbi:sugar ABC transporter ATP-binding protein [Tropicibacter sp. S64]|uniref:sugar ABC transporter ATP-binding protein n=1 Tax=Tropicibacter sp. S64 TaxID=3415122 RepID=UPI003C7972AD